MLGDLQARDPAPDGLERLRGRVVAVPEFFEGDYSSNGNFLHESVRESVEKGGRVDDGIGSRYGEADARSP